MDKELIINQISSLKEELREMVNTAEVQTRSLNDEEKSLFETKKAELDELKKQLAEVDEAEQRALEAAAPKTDKNKSKNTKMEKNYLKNLAQQVSDVVNNRSLEQYNNVAGNTINLRADAYTTVTAGDVEDVQRETFTRILEPLENAVIFQKLGLTFINTGDLVSLPSVSNVECTINGENTKLETQKIAYDKRSITPVRFGCAVGLSNSAVKTIDEHVDILGYSLRAMREAQARLMNKCLFSPVSVTNDGKTVKGIFVDALAADASVAGKCSWANIVALESQIKEKDAEITERAAWVMSPSTADKLRSKPIAVKAPYGDRFILEDGKIDGIPVIESNACNAYDASGNITYSYIGLAGDWSQVIVQEVGAPSLVIDPYTEAKKNIVELVLNGDFGFEVERAENFAVMKVDSTSWTN